MTKLQMAQTIVSTLKNAPHLIAADHGEVEEMARTSSVKSLDRLYDMAVSQRPDLAHQ